MARKSDNTVSLNFISKERMEGLNSEEKIEFILKEVEDGKILILEHGLTPEEQAKLIERTMKEIDSKFVGIEMESYMEERQSFIDKLLGKKKVRLTVVGPADKIKTIYRDKDIIRAVIKG